MYIYYYFCSDCDELVNTSESELLDACPVCDCIHIEAKEYWCTCLIITATKHCSELTITNHNCECHGIQARYFGPAS